MNMHPNKLVPKRHNNPLGQSLAGKLAKFSADIRPLPGIQNPDNLACLVKQLLDSIRRVEFVKAFSNKPLDPAAADPGSIRFDPLKAAVLRLKEGNRDDAVWLVFLAVHFGKHSKDGYTLTRYVYGRYGEDGLWNWQSASADPADFRRWLHDQNATLKPFRFSNHRKYEGLDAFSKNGTGSIIESFVNWIAASGSLDNIITSTHKQVGQNPRDVFNVLYKEMKKVHRFGRLGKFDFLTLLSKLGIAPIVPGSAFVWDGATGPYHGIRLLVTGSRSGNLTRKEADNVYVELENALGVGMQELEDAICNWQKSPANYQHFRG